MQLRISNSDTKTFICERKFYYAYGLGITPKSQSVALSKGLFGHTLLEAWYKEQSISAVHNVYNTLVNQADMYHNPEFAAKDMSKMFYLIMNYIDYYYHNDEASIPKVHHVEEEFEINLKPYVGKDLIFVFKPDVIIEENGKLVVMDHKFVYDFYRPITINLDTQLPKYIVALTLLDKDIRYGILNQVRTRNVQSNRFQREVVTPTYEQFETIWEDHIKVSTRIEQWFRKSDDEKSLSERVFNPLVCRFCSYSELCVADLKGYEDEVDSIIETQMEPYEYGKRNIDYMKELRSSNP